ncbi:MAG: SulP family inorganic anion transporter [Planctomycetes bacterium]|nr:SulP family inorganic anion transporter [Planctomycetota bacterium]
MNLLAHARKDMPASVVVFFVAVPLCLGIALASGAPLFSGLISGIIGGILVGAISRSQLGVSGPAAGLAVIVLAAIGNLGFEAFLLAVALAGLIQVAMGLARCGFIAHFFPSSVIKGMLAGIGVIIVLKQFPHALGHDSDPEGDLAFVQPDGETTLSSFSAMIGDFQISAIVISIVSLAILITWDTVLAKRSRIFRLVQGPLVAVAFGIVYQLVCASFFPSLALQRDHLVNVPVAEGLAGFAGLFTFPDWSRIGDAAVLTTAVTLAVVASLETLLCVEATDKLDPEKRVTPTNRELIAQGCGNFVAGLVGGLPVTQVIVRSSANIQSGARTKLSAILHGVLLLFFVLVLPGVLNLIPLAVLASILLVVGYKLARPEIFLAMFRGGMQQFAPFLLTVLGIVFTDLLTGIGLGMALAILLILRQSYRNSHFLHLEEYDAPNTPHRVTMTLAEELTFLNRGAIVRALSSISDGSHVTIDASATQYMDEDIREVIQEFRDTADRRSITVEWRDRVSRAPLSLAS